MSPCYPVSKQSNGTDEAYSTNKETVYLLGGAITTESRLTRGSGTRGRATTA